MVKKEECCDDKKVKKECCYEYDSDGCKKKCCDPCRPRKKKCCYTRRRKDGGCRRKKCNPGCIILPRAAFARVVRKTISEKGMRISPAAIAVLQQFAESSVGDHISKAVTIATQLTGSKTIMGKHLLVAESVFHVAGGAKISALNQSSSCN
jgi:histone H3/H4